MKTALFSLQPQGNTLAVGTNTADLLAFCDVTGY
jgi:hypothetical protein